MHDTVHMYYLVFLRHVNRKPPRKHIMGQHLNQVCVVLKTQATYDCRFNVYWQI